MEKEIKIVFKNWFWWGFLSLVVVAFYGTLMRYKIAFSFPFFEQKNLLYAHFNFAFSGWINHALYCGLAYLIFPFLSSANQKKYKWLIVFNLICAYIAALLFTFIGSKTDTIIFSALSTLIIAILFAVFYIRDNKLIPKDNLFSSWAITGLLLNILSVVGPFLLAYMMVSKTFTQDKYLIYKYYFLHFQYNGWFFFASMAMLTTILPKNFPNLNQYFKVFAATVIPTFFLSILWFKLPLWLYIITVITTIIQMIAWLYFIKKYIPLLINDKKPSWVHIFMYAATFAMTVKFILQTISIIPSLSHFVFGFRSIIIAYLHLILLGVYSLFIIGYSLYNGFLSNSNSTKFATIAFLVGVVLNELVLGIQGAAGLIYLPIPHINEALFAVTLLLFGSSIFIVISQKIRK